MITLKWILSNQPKIPVLNRLMSKIEVSESGCWLYTGSTDSSGYGKIKIAGKSVGTHKVSYIIHNGDYDQSLEIMHHCDNPLCINPDHMTPVTHKVNMWDSIIKGRHPWADSIIGKKHIINKPECKVIKKFTTRHISEMNGERIYKGSACSICGSEFKEVSCSACSSCRKKRAKKKTCPMLKV